MKKFASIFLGISFTAVAVSSQANTYTVSFHNPGNSGESAMIQTIISDNSVTQIECNSNCTAIPPSENASYTISSNDSNWGIFTAIFTYTESSTTCDSGIQQTKMTYDEVSISDPSVTNPIINVGEKLPVGLTGEAFKISGCATYK